VPRVGVERARIAARKHSLTVCRTALSNTASRNTCHPTIFSLYEKVVCNEFFRTFLVSGASATFRCVKLTIIQVCNECGDSRTRAERECLTGRRINVLSVLRSTSAHASARRSIGANRIATRDFYTQRRPAHPLSGPTCARRGLSSKVPQVKAYKRR